MRGFVVSVWISLVALLAVSGTVRASPDNETCCCSKKPTHISDHQRDVHIAAAAVRPKCGCVIDEAPAMPPSLDAVTASDPPDLANAQPPSPPQMRVVIRATRMHAIGIRHDHGPPSTLLAHKTLALC